MDTWKFSNELKKLQINTAVFACRSSRRMLRLLGRGGTSLPGKLALTVCPDILTYLAADIRVIIVSGTNGKTTTCRFISRWLEEYGIRVLTNRSGANLMAGITAEFASYTSRGPTTAVIECDEAALSPVLEHIRPEVIVLTNVFRDQLDRYGEVSNTLQMLKNAVKKAPTAKLCLNADDPLVASIAGEVCNSTVFYGIDDFSNRQKAERSDAMYCIHCGSKYSYRYVTYGHLGGFVCSNCGYSRPHAQISAVKVVECRVSDSIIELQRNSERRIITVPLPAVYNIYNYLAAVSALEVMGIQPLPGPMEAESISGFGRMEHFPIGAGITMILVKNPAGFTQVIDYLSAQHGAYDLLCCLSDRAADGKDVSWIWDVPLDRLASQHFSPQTVFVSGTRKEDMCLRLKHAGFPEDRLKVVKNDRRFVAGLRDSLRPLIIVPTYTAMMSLRRRLAQMSGGTRFWE